MSRGKTTVLVLIGAAVVLWLSVPRPDDSETKRSEPAADVSEAPRVAPMALPPLAAGGPAPEVVEETEEPSLAAALPPSQPRTATELPDMIQGDQGPVEEYRRQFESEPRSSASAEVESRLRSAFPAGDGAPDMFKSVLCRETICRVELRWSPDRRKAWMVGVSRMGRHPYADLRFLPTMALSPVSEARPGATRVVEVYLKKKPAGLVEKHEH